MISTVELITCLVDQLKDHITESAAQSNGDKLREIVEVIKKSPSFRLDSVGGSSFVESLFRSASPDGTELVASADSNGGSGGYMEYVFRFANEKLNKLDLWNTSLFYKAGRNEDIAELTTDMVPEGGHNLVFAKAYGFRNIQSVMMKMKTKRCKIDFVEIMACPKGCVNGGGQYKIVDRETPLETRDRVAAVSDQLHNVVRRRPEDSPLVRWLYGGSGLNDNPCSLPALEVLHTRYHAIPKLEQIAPLVAKW